YEVEKYRATIGNLQWAAVMDWMCEPQVLAKTGLTIREHQWRTVENYRELRCLGPYLPFVPVLQGWDVRDYMHHIEMYDKAGVDLRQKSLVGIGSVCRRQGTPVANEIIRRITALGIRLHAFGFKLTGLLQVADLL